MCVLVYTGPFEHVTVIDLVFQFKETVNSFFLHLGNK